MSRRTATPTKISQLLADDANPRLHSDRNLAAITASLKTLGAARSIVIDERGVVLAGNGVTASAERAGITRVRVVDTDGNELIAVRRSGLTKKQKKALAVADNRTGELAAWDIERLQLLHAEGLDLSQFWTEAELADLFPVAGVGRRGKTDPEAVPELRRTSIVAGDLFALGRHRLLCGDTTDRASVARLVDVVTLSLLHADPPYGMGKEADGIANDNLYGPKLDAFQLRWWAAWLPSLEANGSAYLWGNAPDLWRLWYVGGLAADDLHVRNEIVWNKGSGFGMRSDGAHCYPPASERCLFLMRGEQFLGNQNKESFWPGYEPLRAWLEAERDKAGWSNAQVNAITETSMAGHWFTQSQFQPISLKHYAALTKAAKGTAFAEPYDRLFDRLFAGVKTGGNAHRRDLSAAMRETRSFFDNTHDAMTDVWTAPRVHGEERFGHATPKPVALAARALQSSTPVGAAVGVPFGGTGPEVIAAEQLGRRACLMEVEPAYCQIIIDRWEAFTGEKATKVAGCSAGASRRRRS